MRALKYTAIGFVAVLAAAAALLLVGIPAGFLIAPLQEHVQAETGYRLEVSGATRLSLLPSAMVTVEGISLHDPASAAADPFVTAGSIRVQAELTSLFGDRPRITEIIVTNPVVRSPLLREHRASAAPAASRTASGSKATAVTVNHFAVHGGTVMFVNAAGGIEGQLDDIEAIASLGDDDQLSAHVSARSGAQVLRVRLSGKAPAGGFDTRPVPVEFTFEAPGMLQGTMTGATEVRKFDALVRFNNVNGAIGENKFSGWASVDVASKPLVKVELDFQKLDLGTVRASGSGSPAQSPQGIDRPWSDEKFSLEGLNFVDAEVQLSAAVLNIGSFHFAPIAMSGTIDNGIVRAAFTQLGVYDGQATGGLAIDATRPEHSYAIVVNAVGVRALPLLTDIADFTALDGNMYASLDLRAWGASERAIMSSLDGTLSALFQDGEFRSLNIAQMIRNVGASILKGWQAGTSEKTDFTQFGAGFRFQNGQATTDNLQLVGPLVRVTGTGTADIGAKTLQFKLEPKLVMSLEGQGSSATPAGLGVPVMVEGPWGQPRIYPEFAGILDNPDAAFSKLKELGLGLFGGSPGQSGSSPAGTDADNSGANSLIQGIGGILKSLGADRPAGAQPSAPANR